MRIRLMAAAGLAGVALLATAGTAAADPDPVGAASNSPGVLSGNVIQIPLDLGFNLCGNSIDLVGLLNPAVGNTCTND
ncbi:MULTISPECIES: chaplin [Streptomyces]|uniref:chaplin n=1 Tax=Streptomyces TaxID=1883 RepID=UPI000EB07B71|nr:MULTISPECIES: chaplin [Streptomyces]MCX4431069.1 chaplin [Streptomyces mirabilis]